MTKAHLSTETDLTSAMESLRDQVAAGSLPRNVLSTSEASAVLAEIERLKTDEQRWRTGFADECRANDRLRAALKEIVDDGDFTAPEGMKRVAREALKS